MIRQFLWSLKKSSRLRAISKKLTPPQDFGESLMQTLAEGGFDALKPRLAEEDAAINELFALVREDPNTGKLLHDYRVNDDVLRDLYSKLVRQGAGTYTNGHWIPASSLAFSQPLQFVLKNRDAEPEQFKRVCYRLWQYFSSNESGDIDD